MSTASMPWVKLFVEILDDSKLFGLPDPLKWRFVQLLLLAGECDAGGWLVNTEAPMTIEQIAWRIRVEIKPLTNDLECLKRSGLTLFDRKLSAWCVTNFEKRQGRPQSKRRELWREQKQRQRRVRTDTGRTPKETDNGVRLTEETKTKTKTKTQDQEGEGAGAPPLNPAGESAESSTNGGQPDVLPAQIRVYLENGGQFAPGKLIDGTTRKQRAIVFICEHVSDTPESLQLWGRVVDGYQAQWSPRSYTVMVNDYYLRGRIPGQPNPSANGKKTPAQRYLSAEETAAENAKLNPNWKGFKAAE